MMNTAAMKGLVAGALVIASVGMGSAYAQSAYQQQSQSDVTVASNSSSSVPPSTERNRASQQQPGVVIRGGYNVGRTTSNDVPGCSGPASFCNMYFGS
jgi:hypothetical protein